jgi:hypothetical protein
MTSAQATPNSWDDYVRATYRKTLRIVLLCALCTIAAMALVVAVASAFPGRDGFTLEAVRSGFSLVLPLGCFAISLAFLSSAWPVSSQMQAIFNGNADDRRAVRRAVLRGGGRLSPEQEEQAAWYASFAAIYFPLAVGQQASFYLGLVLTQVVRRRSDLDWGDGFQVASAILLVVLVALGLVLIPLVWRQGRRAKRYAAEAFRF